MIGDFLLRSDQDRLASTLTTGATLYGKAIDQQAAREVGQGQALYLEFTVGTTFTASGGATGVNVYVAYGTGVDGSGILNAGQLLTVSLNIANAALTAGKRYYIPVPPLIFDNTTGANSIGKRYIAPAYVPVVGTYSAGVFSTRFTDTVQGEQKAYPIGYTVP